MKTLLLSLFYLGFMYAGFSQVPAAKITVKGLVVDSVTAKPLAYVTVVLQDSKTLASIKSSVTGEDGSFSISAPSDKSYSLLLAFIGYENRSIAISPGSAE